MSPGGRPETGRALALAQHGCTVNAISADPRTVTVTSFFGATWSSDRTTVLSGAESCSYAVSTVYVQRPKSQR